MIDRSEMFRKFRTDLHGQRTLSDGFTPEKQVRLLKVYLY